MGEPAPGELLKWEMAETFGWTLETIESLTVAQRNEWLQIQDGRRAAKRSIL